MRAVIALELKYKAPKADTMLEIVYTRWGKAAHITFFFSALLTNLLVSLSMLHLVSTQYSKYTYNRAATIGPPALGRLHKLFASQMYLGSCLMLYQIL